MGTRARLQSILEEILGYPDNVYFQPPPNKAIAYPAIVYERASDHVRYANDGVYTHIRAYTVTVIDKNPDSDIPDKLLMSGLMVEPNRHFAIHNLNHHVYKVYY